MVKGRFDEPSTAWPCCLEFYSVTTRLPIEFRLSPSDAVLLVREELLGRFEVHQLPADSRFEFLATAEADRVAGGRVYDAHIAEVARRSAARVVVMENRPPFHEPPSRRHPRATGPGARR